MKKFTNKITIPTGITLTREDREWAERGSREQDLRDTWQALKEELNAAEGNKWKADGRGDAKGYAFWNRRQEALERKERAAFTAYMDHSLQDMD